VNSRLVVRTATLAAACVLSAAFAWAQAAPAVGAAASGKIGVMNARAAIASTAEGKQAQAELQSQFAPRQNELEALNKQINDIRQRLQTMGDKLSADEQVRLQRQGEVLTRQFERKRTEMQEDADAAQAEVFERLSKKMNDVLDRYARENGYVVLFDYSAQNTPIVNFSNQVDVTQDIIRLYDQAYPIKAGAATQPKPAAPKPAPTTPTTTPAKP
jgi:outer membrane protein